MADNDPSVTPSRELLVEVGHQGQPYNEHMLKTLLLEKYNN